MRWNLKGGCCWSDPPPPQAPPGAGARSGSEEAGEEEDGGEDDGHGERRLMGSLRAAEAEGGVGDREGLLVRGHVAHGSSERARPLSAGDENEMGREGSGFWVGCWTRRVLGAGSFTVRDPKLRNMSLIWVVLLEIALLAKAT